MKFKHLITFFLSIVCVIGYGQDVHFSQFNFSPLHLNPAMAGFMESGNHRITINHRNQWSSILENHSFKTSQIAYDGRVCIGRDFLAFGANLISDVVGNPELKTINGLLAFSYHTDLKRKERFYLAPAGQLGFWQLGLKPNDFRFDSQFDGGLGFHNGDNLENFDLDRFRLRFADFGIGVLVYDTKKQIHGGFAIHHSFVSQRSNVLDQNQLGTRFVAHGAYSFSRKISTIQKSIRLLVTFQEPHWESVFLYEMKKNLGGNASKQPISIKGGIGGRVSSNYTNDLLSFDAAIVNLQLNNFLQNTTLGVNYDFNTSKLFRASRGAGAFEVSLQFLFDRGDGCLICPN